jgi:hypothetical protein
VPQELVVLEDQAVTVIMELMGLVLQLLQEVQVAQELVVPLTAELVMNTAVLDLVAGATEQEAVGV